MLSGELLRQLNQWQSYFAQAKSVSNNDLARFYEQIKIAEKACKSSGADLAPLTPYYAAWATQFIANRLQKTVASLKTATAKKSLSMVAMHRHMLAIEGVKKALINRYEVPSEPALLQPYYQLWAQRFERDYQYNHDAIGLFIKTIFAYEQDVRGALSSQSATTPNELQFDTSLDSLLKDVRKLQYYLAGLSSYFIHPFLPQLDSTAVDHRIRDELAADRSIAYGVMLEQLPGCIEKLHTAMQTVMFDDDNVDKLLLQFTNATTDVASAGTLAGLGDAERRYEYVYAEFTKMKQVCRLRRTILSHLDVFLKEDAEGCDDDIKQRFTSAISPLCEKRSQDFESKIDTILEFDLKKSAEQVAVAMDEQRSLIQSVVQHAADYPDIMDSAKLTDQLRQYQQSLQYCFSVDLTRMRDQQTNAWVPMQRAILGQTAETFSALMVQYKSSCEALKRRLAPGADTNSEMRRFAQACFTALNQTYTQIQPVQTNCHERLEKIETLVETFAMSQRQFADFEMRVSESNAALTAFFAENRASELSYADVVARMGEMLETRRTQVAEFESLRAALQVDAVDAVIGVGDDARQKAEHYFDSQFAALGLEGQDKTLGQLKRDYVNSASTLLRDGNRLSAALSYMEVNLTALDTTYAYLKYLVQIGQLAASPYYIKHGTRIALSRALPQAASLDDDVLQLLRRFTSDEHRNLFSPAASLATLSSDERAEAQDAVVGELEKIGDAQLQAVIKASQDAFTAADLHDDSSSATSSAAPIASVSSSSSAPVAIDEIDLCVAIEQAKLSLVAQQRKQKQAFRKRALSSPPPVSAKAKRVVDLRGVASDSGMLTRSDAAPDWAAYDDNHQDPMIASENQFFSQLVTVDQLPDSNQITDLFPKVPSASQPFSSMSVQQMRASQEACNNFKREHVSTSHVKFIEEKNVFKINLDENGLDLNEIESPLYVPEEKLLIAMREHYLQMISEGWNVIKISSPSPDMLARAEAFVRIQAKDLGLDITINSVCLNAHPDCQKLDWQVYASAEVDAWNAMKVHKNYEKIIPAYLENVHFNAKLDVDLDNFKCRVVDTPFSMQKSGLLTETKTRLPGGSPLFAKESPTSVFTGQRKRANSVGSWKKPRSEPIVRRLADEYQKTEYA